MRKENKPGKYEIPEEKLKNVTGGYVFHSDIWHCPNCGHENNIVDACVKCGKLRHDDPGDPGNPGRSLPWICPTCGLMNGPAAQVCRCGAAKPA